MDINSFLDELVLEQQPSIREAFILDSLVSEGIREPKKKDNDSLMELSLPPANEAEFFTKILWETLYPNEPTIDPFFREMVTKIIYNVADSGKLHNALADWITERIMEVGKAKDISTAENMAEGMLAEYESYFDILNELQKPKTKKIEKN